VASKTPEAETAAAASAALVASLVGLLGMACQSARPLQPTAERRGVAEHRIAVGSEQYGQVVLAQVGDILAVKPAPPGPGWAVEFDRGILAALGSEESRRNPGPEGWLFRCVGVGTSELALTAPASPCPAGAVCPPAQFEFRTRIAVRSRTSGGAP
jgi:hypothetical protein